MNMFGGISIVVIVCGPARLDLAGQLGDDSQGREGSLHAARDTTASSEDKRIERHSILRFHHEAGVEHQRFGTRRQALEGNVLIPRWRDSSGESMGS